MGPTVRAKATVPMPTRPPSRAPTASDGELDAGADHADGVAAPGHAGHEPVAGPGSEAGADVAAAARAEDVDPEDEERDPLPHRLRCVDHREGGVHHHADHEHVEQGAEPGALPDRDPQEQHHDTR